MPKPLAARRRLGKYKLVRRLATGGFGTVWRALDTVEGVHVALKVPRMELVTPEALEWFRKEVRLHAALDHPNVLLVKNADLIEGHFVVAYPLGLESLGERMRRRMGIETILDLGEQMLEAVAHAHERHVIHCDVKPENFILFEGGRLRLTDFSISRFAHRTVLASGSGTIGYVAPEQAMGRTSFRSDVFSLGLILYEMLAGELPEWPFRWPPPGHVRLRRRVPVAFERFLRKALRVEPEKRFRDAPEMLSVYVRLLPQVRRHVAAQRNKLAPEPKKNGRDWTEVRFRQFRRQHGKTFELRHECTRCKGPVAEPMAGCPWCGVRLDFKKHESDFPAECPRCHRGCKLDWRYCPWCYGPGFDDVSERSYSDRRYEGRCSEPSCRGPLMPFMRYCPWCHRKVRKTKPIAGSKERCRRCGWGVVRTFWEHCPWCVRRLEKR